MALDFDFETGSENSITARWEEIASMFIDPDEQGWCGYPVYGVEYTDEATGRTDGEDITNYDELFAWVVKPIRDDPDRWQEELEHVDQFNTITPEAISTIERRMADIIPF